MPNWKKVITSGSDAALNSLLVTNGITGSLLGTASTASFVTGSNVYGPYGSNSVISASYAANGGVTQLLAGPNVILSPTNGLGQVTVSATLSGSTIFNTATGSYGSFYDTTTQTNPVADVPRSMSFNSTDITNGVSISGSTSPFNTYIKTQNAGVYDIQFSAQIDKTDSGTDEIVIWLRKNGTDLTDSATTLTLTGNNDKQVAAWNWFVSSATGDYYQIIWRSLDTDLRLLAEPISGTHPGIPSVIATVNRVDQFLSNTGSFSGSFTGVFTGSLQGTSSYATQALSSSFATTAATASFLNGGTNGFIQNGNSFGTTATLGTNDNQSLAFETNGTTRMFISSSGNVGIGTSTPNAKLDVSGSVIISGSLIQGSGSRATGTGSHAEGRSTLASGLYSHAEGYSTTASGEYSHAEGRYSTTSGVYSHAEGNSTIAQGVYSHAEGESTIASGSYSHAEGDGTISSGYYSHAEGTTTQAIGDASHAEGRITLASGANSHAEGDSTQAIGDGSHAEGVSSKTGATTAYLVEAFGGGILPLSSVYGDKTSEFSGGSVIIFDDSSFDGSYGKTTFTVASSTFDGTNTIVTLTDNTINGSGAIIGNLDYINSWTGDQTLKGDYSHAEGTGTIAIGDYSHAEGDSTKAFGLASHAEGTGTIAQGEVSHAEGRSTIAQGEASHAEGRSTIAQGNYSHAEGESTIAIGVASHAAGFSTSASGDYQSVIGQFNIPSSAQSAFIIGNGTANASRSNLVFASGSQFQITGSLNVTGSTIITGSLIVTSGITGSLLGTSSYATQALSSSFATTATTASFLNGGTNGFIQNGNSFGTTATLGTNDNNSLQFETNNSTRMFISSSGNVGIGTVSPTAKLDVAGTLTVASTSSAAQPYNVLFSKNISGSTGGYNSTTTNTLTVTATTSSGYQSAALKNTLGIATNASYNYTFGHEWSAMTNELVIGSYGSVPFAADSIANTVISTINGYTRTIGTLYDMKFDYFNYGTVSTHYGIYHGASDAKHYFAGNIGIGTTSPTAKLHVAAPGALSSDIGFKVRNSANTGDILNATGAGNVQVGVGGISICRTDTPNGSLLSTITYTTGAVTRFSTAIETPGGLYGSTTTDTSILALSLGYYGIGLRCYGSSTTTGFTFNTIVATTGTYFMRMQNGATDLFTILTSGSIGISNSAPKYKLDVSGSARISGERNTSISSSLVVYGSGSAQPVFTVQGSQGELFSVTDSLSGSLFSVNDISGLPIMEVFSDNTTLIGSYQAPSLNTTVKTTTAVGNNVIYSVPTASYNGAWFEYVATSASNARAGQIMSVCSSNTITYTETTTTDIGSTAGLNFMVMITGSNFALTGSSTTAGWTIKTIVRSI